MGELALNRGMELFIDNIPTYWNATTPDLISQVTQQGRVHSGNSAVNLADMAVLSQTITNINPGCFYDFSFYARGEGDQVGLTATITFVTPTTNIEGALITVRPQDIPDGDRGFTFYRAVTTAAPADVSSAIISFSVNANGGQSLDIDDVSFKVD